MVVTHHRMLERRRVVTSRAGHTGPDCSPGGRAMGAAGTGKRGQRVTWQVRTARRAREGFRPRDENDLRSVRGAQPDPDLPAARTDVDVAHPPAVTPQTVRAGVAHQPTVGARLQDQMPS